MGEPNWNSSDPYAWTGEPDPGTVAASLDPNTPNDGGERNYAGFPPGIYVELDGPDPDDGETDPCQLPCHPSANCQHCAAYWERMRAEGFWRDATGWTDSAVREWNRA